MNGLLKSKVFKKNLCKWLVMYVSILGLFATVVTYSKYMSSLQLNGKAETAKFVVNVTYPDSCKDSTESCSIGSLRPTSNYNFDFNIETQLDVKTLLHLDIYLNEKMEIVDLYRDGAKLTKDTDYAVIGNVVTIDKTIDYSDSSNIDNYRVVAKLKEPKTDESFTLNDAVKVGYSATQID